LRASSRLLVIDFQTWQIGARRHINAQEISRTSRLTPLLTVQGPMIVRIGAPLAEILTSLEVATAPK
jgi:hypothetical protein